MFPLSASLPLLLPLSVRYSLLLGLSMSHLPDPLSMPPLRLTFHRTALPPLASIRPPFLLPLTITHVLLLHLAPRMNLPIHPLMSLSMNYLLVLAALPKYLVVHPILHLPVLLSVPPLPPTLHRTALPPLPNTRPQSFLPPMIMNVLLLQLPQLSMNVSFHLPPPKCLPPSLMPPFHSLILLLVRLRR